MDIVIMDSESDQNTELNLGEADLPQLLEKGDALLSLIKVCKVV